MRRTIATIAVLAVATAAGAQFKNAASGTQQPVPSQPAAATDTTKAADPLAAARRISIKEAQKLVAANKAVFVDVRGSESYDQGHIKGALNISGSDLSKRLKDLPKGKTIITYCAWTAEHTSARAVLDLNAQGITNAAALVGGWNAWKDAKLPIAAAKPKAK